MAAAGAGAETGGSPSSTVKLQACRISRQLRATPSGTSTPNFKMLRHPCHHGRSNDPFRNCSFPRTTPCPAGVPTPVVAKALGHHRQTDHPNRTYENETIRKEPSSVGRGPPDAAPGRRRGSHAWPQEHCPAFCSAATSRTGRWTAPSHRAGSRTLETGWAGTGTPNYACTRLARWSCINPDSSMPRSRTRGSPTYQTRWTFLRVPLNHDCPTARPQQLQWPR